MKTEEDKYLDLLSIFHYVVGGSIALFACLSLIHVALGVAMIMGKLNGNNPPPAAFGWLFVIFGATFVFFGWSLAAAMIVAGRKLKKRKSRIYCLVIGAIECMMLPFGTILGILTIIVLMKDSVKEKFS